MSNFKEITFTLDMIYQKKENIGTLVRFDTGSNKLVVRLTYENQNYDITTATAITMVIRDDEGFLTSADCTIESAEDGIISVVLPDNCIGYRRIFHGEVQVYFGANRLTSSIFKYDVRDELSTGADPSVEPTFPILEQLILDVTTLESQVETAEANRVSAEEARVLAEQQREAQLSAIQDTLSADYYTKIEVDGLLDDLGAIDLLDLDSDMATAKDDITTLQTNVINIDNRVATLESEGGGGAPVSVTHVDETLTFKEPETKVSLDAGLILAGNSIKMSSYLQRASVADYVSLGEKQIPDVGFPFGVLLSPDEKTLYVLDYETSGSIKKYTMPTPLDFDNLTYVGVVVASIESSYALTVVRDMAMSADGKTLYVLGDGTSNGIAVFTMVESWDIDNASYVGTYNSIIPTNSIKAFDFKPDGTTLFLHDATAKNLYEITLTTPWDVTAGSTAKTVALTQADIRAIKFIDEGATLLLASPSTDMLHQYDLTTAWDIDTLVDTTNTFDFGDIEYWFTATGMCLSADEGLVIVANYDDSSLGVLERTVGVLSANATVQLSDPEDIYGWDLATLQRTEPNTSEVIINLEEQESTVGDLKSWGYDGEFTYTGIFTENTVVKGIKFQNDGSGFSIFANNTLFHVIIQDEPFELASERYVGNKVNFADLIVGADINRCAVNNEGTVAFALDNSGILYEVRMLRPWDFKTAYYTGRSQDVSVEIVTGIGMAVSNDGTKMIIADKDDDTLHSWDIGTAWTLESITYDTFYPFGTETAYPENIALYDNGRKLAIVDYVQSDIHEYSMSDICELTGITYDGAIGTRSLERDIRYPCAMTVSNYGENLYIADRDTFDEGHKITRFELGTANSILGTKTYLENEYASLPSPDVAGVTYNSDGSKMYMFNDMSRLNIAEYDLLEVYNANTKRLKYSVENVISLSNNAKGLMISPDESKLYIKDNSMRIHQFDLNVSGELSFGHVLTTTSFEPLVAPDVVGGVQAMEFNPDGTLLYIFTNDTLYEFSLAEPYDTKNPTYTGNSVSIAISLVMGMKFLDGGKSLVIFTKGADVYEWIMSTPYDIINGALNPTIYVEPRDLVTHEDVTFYENDASYLVAIDHQLLQYSTGDGIWSTLMTDITRDTDISAIPKDKLLRFNVQLNRTNGADNPSCDYLALRYIR